MVPRCSSDCNRAKETETKDHGRRVKKTESVYIYIYIAEGEKTRVRIELEGGGRRYVRRILEAVGEVEITKLPYSGSYSSSRGR